MKKNRKHIVVVTDCNDVASNELRAVLVTETEKFHADVEIEPIVKTQEFSVINGAFIVRLLADIYNPKNTIFLVVINALKTARPDRARLIGETTNGFTFVGENTGTLGWLIKDFGIKKIFETSQNGLDGKKFISFGGKYVHAPIAAKIAAGTPMEELGYYFDENRVTYIDLPKGTVLHIDNFGVPKIYDFLDHFVEGDKLKVFVNDKNSFKAIYTSSMKNLPDGTIAIYKGSSLENMAEIGIVRCLGTASKLNIHIGDRISWQKYES